MDSTDWTKERYDTTVTSTFWWFTPYDKADPSYWQAVSQDADMRDIVEMELSLDTLQEWVSRVGIGYFPPCGLYDFPNALLQVLDLIGCAGAPDASSVFKHQCYAVDRKRKAIAEDYCLCLDAWLAGTGPEAPAAELLALSSRDIDWQAVCKDLWKVLEAPSKKKQLLVEVLLEAMRYAIKATKWDDERGTEFGRDRYVGDYVTTPEGDASYKVLSSPRVKRLEAELSALDPDWRRLIRVDLGFWWLCAPKAFRFLENDLWAIGHDRPAGPDDHVEGFLQCRDTYPDNKEAAQWYSSFCDALDAWWQGREPTGSVGSLVASRLGESSPEKRWLVRVFLKKLKTYEKTGASLGIMTNPESRQKWGTKPMEIR